MDNDTEREQLQQLKNDIQHTKAEKERKKLKSKHVRISTTAQIQTRKTIGIIPSTKKVESEGWFGTYGHDFTIQNNKQVRRDACSLYIFDASFEIRQAMVWFTEWIWFDRFIIIIIIANSVMLCLQDMDERIKGPTYWSDRNFQLEKLDLAFTIVFILECACKIIAKGFIFHKFSYLRDAWNWLDFFVVIISVLNFLPSVNSGGLKSLRTFRILRPLRTINRLPKMKQLIEALFASLPGLFGVLVFLGFTFILFAIFGIQSFGGAQYQFCRTTAQPQLTYNSEGQLTAYEWPIVSTFSWLCSNDKDCERFIGIFGADPHGPTPPVFKCGATINLKPKIKAGGKLNIDNISQNSAILYDLVNFNNIANSLLTIFQVLSLENWTDGMMYNYMDASNYYVSAFYFITLVLFGAFFIMNLVLAQIIESFDEKSHEQSVNNNNDEFVVKRSKFLGLDLHKADELEVSHLDKIEDTVQSRMQKSLKNHVTDQLTQELNDQDDALIDESPVETDARKRSYRNSIYRMFFVISIHWVFNMFITMAIILNTLSLAVERHDQSLAQEQLLYICNIIFTWLFAAEMFFKIIGLGPRQYVKDYYNVFDALIVMLSITDFVINQTLGENVGQAAGALKAFRALRLLRMIKLARRWKQLQEILKKMLASLEGIFYFSMLLLLFMYIFSLLGMQFFGKYTFKDLDGHAVLKDELVERYNKEILEPIRWSFDNIWLSMNTIYVIIMSDGWNIVMYENVLPFGDKWAPYSLFFVLMQVLGNKVMLSLFTAILLQNFEGSTEEEQKEEKEKPNQKSLIKRIFSKETFEKVYADIRDIFGYRQTKGELKLAQAHERAIQAELNNSLQKVVAEQAAGPASGQDAPAFVINVAAMRDEEPESNDQIKISSVYQDIEPSIISVHDQASEAKEIEDEIRQIERIEQKQEEKLGNMQRADSQLNMSMRSATNKKLSQILHQRSAVHYKLQEQVYSPTRQFTQQFVAEGTSLWCLSETNPVRRCLVYFTKHRYFDNTILLLIAITTINLAIESPLDDPKNNKKLNVLNKIDYAMNAIFTLEMVLKILAQGFLLNGPKSYLRDSWNIIDFVSVLSSLLSMNPNTSDNFKVLKILRVLKVLRPLKMVSRNKGLKISIMSLIKSLPDIGNLQLIIIFFLFLLGILHTTLFGGLFWSCRFDHLRGNGSMSFQQTEVLIKTKWDCINYGGEWVNQDFMFDSILDSMICLFSIQSTEGWNDPVMWSQIDSTDLDMQPKKWQKPYYIIFSIFVNIITNLLFLNLFVGVVIESFNNQKEILIGLKNLKKRQLDWINLQIMGYQAKPKFKIMIKSEFSIIRQKAIQIVQHSIFERFIMICIVGNTLVLCLTWYGQDSKVDKITDIINYVFMAIFTIECVLKLVAIRTAYFKEAWNIFDFIVVLTTLVILVIGFFNIGNFAIQATILRSMRIGRLLRVMRFAKKLQIIFKTLTEAAPSLASLGMLLLLVIFMYSIIGMKMFGFANVTNQTTVNYHCNFKNFFNAFLTLVRSATGEAWDNIMYDMGRSKSILFQCESSQEYADLVANNMVTNRCGSQAGSALYFFTFIILVCQIFLNLFIAIIVDSFVAQNAASALPVESNDIEIFVEAWSNLDTNATGQLSARFLDTLMEDLEHANCKLLPQELRESDKENDWFIKETKQAYMRRQYIARLNCVIYNDWTKEDTSDIPCVTFIDLLQSMLREQFRVVHDRESSEKKIRIYKLKALISCPKITQKEKDFLQGHLQNEEKQLESELLTYDFEGFNLGLDYNSRKIDLLQDLRKIAAQALVKIKTIDELKSHPKRQEKLDMDYEYYVKWHTVHRQRPIENNDGISDSLQVSGQLPKPLDMQGLMSKERFDRKIFNVELTTFHYSYFNHVADNWKRNKARRMLLQSGLRENESSFSSQEQPVQQIDRVLESGRSQKNNKIVPSMNVVDIPDNRQLAQERKRQDKDQVKKDNAAQSQ